MQRLRLLFVVLGFSIAIGTNATYGQSGYAHAANKISQYATYELGTAYETGDYSNILIYSSTGGGNISVELALFDDDYNLVWSSYWPNWGTVGQDGWYSSTPGQIHDSDEGWWVETWYVDGVPLSPLNFNDTYFYQAPELPIFHVDHNYTGNNGPTPYGYWPYNPVYYNTDYSSVPIYVSDVMSFWSYSLGYDLYLAQSTYPHYYMIGVTDGNLGGNGKLGETYWDQYSANCIGQCSNACLIDAIDGAVVVLDLTEISNAYYALYQANPGLIPDAMLKEIIRHETGHAIGLLDINLQSAKGICSEVQSLMYNRSPMILCGNNYPTNRDLNVLFSLYPSMNWCDYTPVDQCIPYSYCY